MKYAGIRALSTWTEETGLSSITVWRFRKKGWLETVNISGRPYVTDEAIEKFVRRAESGEFSQVHKVPQRAAA
jgi:hypothetical protein